MRIDGVDPLLNKEVKKTQGGASSTGESFADMLGSVTGNAQSTSAASTSSAGPISSVPFLVPPAAESAFDSSAAVSDLESLLGDLGMLKNSLKNSDIPVEQLQPLIDKLIEHKDDLASYLGNTSDDELKSVISDAMSLVIDQVNQYNGGYA